MKKLYLTLFAFLIAPALWAQLNVYVNADTKDSVISTPFDTLNTVMDENGKLLTTDKVVAIRNVHNKVSSYWLFFYFLPTDIGKTQPINIRKGNYAYFGMDKGIYLRIPYTGKSFTYKYPDMAGFFIEVTNHLDLLKTTKLNFIRLETSELYHEINLDNSGNLKIASILQTLLK